MVDVSGTAGTVFGIAGMGIGLGLLAHTASNIARSTDRMYDRRRPQRISQRGRRSPKSKSMRMDTSRDRGFGSSFRFNPQPISLTRPARSFRWSND